MNQADAARWMFEQFNAEGMLYQEVAASHLLQHNDDRLAFYDAQGSMRVNKAVLKEFEKLTPDAVYERADRYWRRRLTTDQPGRQQ